MATTISASAGFTYTVSGELSVHECPTCGVLHGVPVELVSYADRHRPCFPIHCPNGHTWGYGGRSKDEQLEAARNGAARARAERDQEAASAKAYRGAATRARSERDKAKARIAKGVCPCCNRHFKNVERHMAEQHPDYHLPGENK